MAVVPLSADRLVLQSRPPLWIFVAIVIIATIAAGDALLRDRIEVAVALIVWAGLIEWSMYLVLVRPRVIVSLDGLDVRNPFARHFVSWGALDRTLRRGVLQLVLHDGTRIRAMGVPIAGLNRAAVSDYSIFATEPVTNTDLRHHTVGSVDDVIGEWLYDRTSALGEDYELPDSIVHDHHVDATAINVTILLGLLAVAGVVLVFVRPFTG